MPDQRILYTEEMVGANHPTKADTLNRLALAEHNSDGTHKVFVSAEQTITSAGALTLAHGLGAAPKFVELFIKNTSAENGYSAGDIVAIQAGRHAANRGVGVKVDATNITIRFGSDATSALEIIHGTVGSTAIIGNSSWNLIVRAWL